VALHTLPSIQRSVEKDRLIPRNGLVMSLFSDKDDSPPLVKVFILAPPPLAPRRRQEVKDGPCVSSFAKISIEEISLKSRERSTVCRSSDFSIPF